MNIDIRQKNLELAEKLVQKANMSTRPAYYSGCGARLEDFEFGKNSLDIIFKELREVDEIYALNFINLVLAFENLNATDFLTSFYIFAKNNFSLENFQITEKGYSLETNSDEERDAVAIGTIFSILGNSSGRDDTICIKKRFLNRLPKDITERPKVKEYINKMNRDSIRRSYY